MRIRAEHAPDSTQGAHKFRALLTNELQNMGHHVTDWSSNEPFDVVISRGPLSQNCLEKASKIGAKIIVQYGGGTTWSPNGIMHVRRTMHQADGVVFNSKFGQDEIHSIVVPTCPETVIHNGSPRLKRAPLDKPIFMTACDSYDMATKNRGLKTAIAGVERLRKSLPEAQLWVAGRAPTLPGVDRYLGMIKNHTELAEERSKAIALIHLVENDNCPNTVLEALAQGIPVIHDVKGGTKEIVQWFGHQIVDPTPAKVAMGCFMMWTCASAWQDKWMDEFDQTLKIDVVAKKYETFIERISYG